MPDLSSLLTRLEGAEGPDREVDFDLCAALQEKGALGIIAHVPKLTASLDAALALAERVLPGHRTVVEQAHDKTGWAMIQTGPETPRNMTDGPTPALALLTALLRALINQQQGEGS